MTTVHKQHVRHLNVKKHHGKHTAHGARATHGTSGTPRTQGTRRPAPNEHVWHRQNGIWIPPAQERDHFDGPRRKPVDLSQAGVPGTRGPNGYTPAIPPSPSVPTAVLSYFNGKQLDQILGSLQRSNLPKGTPVYMGDYGASKATIDKIHAAGVRYAPIFRPFGRAKEAAYNGRLPGVQGDPKYAGPVPDVKSLSADDRVKWGTELGRRFRDQMRAQGKDAQIDAWQLDEIVPSMTGGANQVAPRQFFRGVLDGIHQGRPEAGDPPMQGIVHTSIVRELGIKKNDPEMKAFWKSLDEATFRVAGEEYVSPRQGAKAEADLQDRFHDELYGDPHADSVANKYIVELTPGFNSATAQGYGGRPSNMTDAQWTEWQRQYAVNRADDSGVTGFAGYNFVGENSTPEHIDSMIQNLAAGIRAEWKTA